MCIEDSEVIVLQNSSQQTRSSATVKTPFVQCTVALLIHSLAQRLYDCINEQTNKQSNKHCCCTGDAGQLPRRSDWALTVQSLRQISVSHSGDKDPLLGDVTLSSRVSVLRRFEGAKRFRMQEFIRPKNNTWRRRNRMPSKRRQTPSHRHAVTHISQYLRAAEACWRQHINSKNSLL
jgi:hypothetical protein